MPLDKGEWLAASRLWLVLDRQAAAPRSLPQITALARAGGVDAVLCRIRGEAPEQVRRTAREVRDVAAELGLPFVMSHDVDLALELEADSVQLGVGDATISEVKARLAPGVAVGCSTHSVAEAAAVFGLGADYVFLGPVFPTPDKLKYGPPLGVKAVHDAVALPGVVVFIGGINADNIELVRLQGGVRVAAISALQRVDDPVRAAQKLKALLIR